MSTVRVERCPDCNAMIGEGMLYVHQQGTCMGYRSPNVTVKLSRVEVDHLLTLLRDADREGAYYGPREQYRARHARITAKFESVNSHDHPHTRP